MRNACKILARELGCNAKFGNLHAVIKFLKINYTKVLVGEFGLDSVGTKQESRMFIVNTVMKVWAP